MNRSSQDEESASPQTVSKSLLLLNITFNSGGADSDPFGSARTGFGGSGKWAAVIDVLYELVGGRRL